MTPARWPGAVAALVFDADEIRLEALDGSRVYARAAAGPSAATLDALLDQLAASPFLGAQREDLRRLWRQHVQEAA